MNGLLILKAILSTLNSALIVYFIHSGYLLYTNQETPLLYFILSGSTSVIVSATILMLRSEFNIHMQGLELRLLAIKTFRNMQPSNQCI